MNNNKNADTSARAAITERNARESPLLRLPAELRNKIWHYVIDTNVCNFVTVNGTKPHDQTVILKNPQLHRRALLRVCLQIHYETSKMPVTFTMTFDSLWTLLEKIISIPKRMCSAIDEIRFVLRFTSSQEEVFIIAIIENVRPLVSTLPNLKRVDITYVLPRSNSYVEQNKRQVEDWLRWKRRGLEIVSWDITSSY